MNVRDALETRPWFRRLRLVKRRCRVPAKEDFERDAAVQDFEVALRAAYTRGFDDAIEAEAMSIDWDAEAKPVHGVTAGAAAMMEES